jgi:hypothetical protein
VSTVGGPIESRRPQSGPDPEVLRQQELARQQELEREQEREQERELERQQEQQREREREAELARLRDLERQRAEEVERLREQERQRALEVERLREQEREREQQRAREREQERQRAQEAERLREQERQRAQEAERLREQEREREQALEREREQAREREREQERQREQQRQKERELDRERERARALEQAAAAQTVEESVLQPVAEEDPIVAQIAAYRRPVREIEEAPADEAPTPEESAEAADEALAQEPLDFEAPAQEETPAYEEPEPEAAYAQQAQQAEAPSEYTISEDTEKKGRLPLLAMAAVVILLLAAIGWFATRDTARTGDGELVVQSRPQGARVVVDGKESGVTPTTIRLPAGPHVLEVQVGKSEPRVIPLTITAGVQTSQYIELRDVSATGGLEIRSDPPGARITIDGQPRGITPANIPNLAAGDHTVVLELGGRKVSQAVKIAPGSSQQLVIPIPRK